MREPQTTDDIAVVPDGGGEERLAGNPSEIRWGSVRIRGPAAQTIATFAPTLIGAIMLAGGVPAFMSGTNDLEEIKRQLEEIKRGQDKHIEQARLVIAAYPTPEELDADHDELVRLRASVTACCGETLPPPPQPRRRPERVTMDATEGPSRPEAERLDHADAGTDDAVPVSLPATEPPAVAKRP